MGHSVSTGNEPSIANTHDQIQPSFPKTLDQTSFATTDEPQRGQVIVFHSSSKLKAHFDEASKHVNKLIVIDFTASWCGPCQHIQPAVSEFAETYKDVEFIKIDVDELEDVSRQFGVEVMPTFILLKNGKEVDRVGGAKKDVLKNKIEEHRL